MKRITQIYSKVIVVAAIVIAGSVATVAPQVGALECGVLPQSVCNKAEAGGSGDVEDTGVWALLLLIINIMTAGIVLLAIGGVVYGAVLYTSAGSSQEQIKKARSIITNTVIGIIAFVLMYGLLQWLIPGGVFNGAGGSISV